MSWFISWDWAWSCLIPDTAPHASPGMNPEDFLFESLIPAVEHTTITELKDRSFFTLNCKGAQVFVESVNIYREATSLNCFLISV